MPWILGLVGLGLGPGAVAFGLGGYGPPSMPATVGSGFVVTQPQQLPDWLADAQGIAFEQSFGATKDSGLALLKDAIKARWPSADQPDALPMQGRDRRILRAPPETDAQYAARLQLAHDIWLWAGTPTSMVNILAPYGYSAAMLSDYASSNVSVLNNWRGILEGDQWFSRFIVLVASKYWTGPAQWDQNVVEWSDTTVQTWDSSMTQMDVDYLRSSVRTFKSDWSYPVLIAVLVTSQYGGLWDAPPVQVWDNNPQPWADSQDHVILIPTGHVIEENENFYGGGSGALDSGFGDLTLDAGETMGYAPPSIGWATQ